MIATAVEDFQSRPPECSKSQQMPSSSPCWKLEPVSNRRIEFTASVEDLSKGRLKAEPQGKGAKDYEDFDTR
jgi:hypothetical protein